MHSDGGQTALGVAKQLSRIQQRVFRQQRVISGLAADVEHQVAVVFGDVVREHTRQLAEQRFLAAAVPIVGEFVGEGFHGIVAGDLDRQVCDAPCLAAAQDDRHVLPGGQRADADILSVRSHLIVAVERIPKRQVYRLAAESGLGAQRRDARIDRRDAGLHQRRKLGHGAVEIQRECVVEYNVL